MADLTQVTSDLPITIDKLRINYRKEILRIAAQYGAYNIRVFGSVARGEANQNSDIDFL